MIALTSRVKYFVLILAFVFSGSLAFGQEATPKNNKANRTKKFIQEEAGRPDIPGDLMIEYGFNWMQDHPAGYSFNTMKSNTINLYYLYDFNIGESAFSFHPGIGVGTEKYAFADNITLGYGNDSLGNKEVQFVPLDSIYSPGTSYKKTKINANYFDIPMELRWRSRKYDAKRSLKIVVGGKVGFLFSPKTKVKYVEDGETKISKQKEKFEMSALRYGAYARIGFGGFSAFYYYSLSDVFKKDKGPMNTKMYPMSFGLSLALF